MILMQVQHNLIIHLFVKYFFLKGGERERERERII